MAYLTYDDLKEVVSDAVQIQLTDDDHAGVIDFAILDDAIASAEGEVESYLGTRYVMPMVVPLPANVKKWTLDICNYYLHQRRQVPDKVRLAYEDAIARLKDANAGKTTLPLPAPPLTVPALLAIDGSIQTEERVFSRSLLEEY